MKLFNIFSSVLTVILAFTGLMLVVSQIGTALSAPSDFEMAVGVFAAALFLASVVTIAVYFLRKAR